MTADELRRLLNEPESETLEFKRNLPERQQLAALVAAFANTHGGVLIIGADGRGPTHVGLAHPGVTADHARTWIEALVEPTPDFSIELVSIEPGRTLVVISVAPGEDRPYVGGGRVLERRGDRLVPISRERITEVVNVAVPEQPAVEHMAAVIATLSELVERLEAQLHWRRQLPLQVALVIAGVVMGYLLGVWNPLG